MWKKCRKKPIEVHFRNVAPEGEIIYTREGNIRAYPDKDYIIKGIRGELYPIGKDIFEDSYEVIEDEDE